MKIYVASSWRNDRQVDVVAVLRSRGHEVYDFKNPEPGNHGFGWKQLGLGDFREWTGQQCREALAHPIARHAFATDSGALAWADCCVLLYPCGNDAHMEAGWAAGAGKLLVVVFADKADPGLMDLYADKICVSVDELVVWLETSSLKSCAHNAWENLPPRGNTRRCGVCGVVQRFQFPRWESVPPAEYPEVEWVAQAAVMLDGRCWALPRPARHHDVIARISPCGFVGRCAVQGFRTNRGRFVGREEAARVALAAGQIAGLPDTGHLFTEDLW